MHAHTGVFKIVSLIYTPLFSSMFLQVCSYRVPGLQQFRGPHNDPQQIRDGDETHGPPLIIQHVDAVQVVAGHQQQQLPQAAVRITAHKFRSLQTLTTLRYW